MSKDSRPPRTQLKRAVKNDDELGDSAGLVILEYGISCATYRLVILVF